MKFYRKILQNLFLKVLKFLEKMKGYLTNEANIIGLESRTSSPLSIPRDNITLQHIKIKTYFHVAKALDMQVGIVSAAIDGKKVAEKYKSLRFKK